MPNADMRRLMDQVRVNLPGALDAAILIELFSTLKEFFQKTNCWREDIDFPVTPSGNTRFEDPDAYRFDLVPTQGSVVRLFGVSCPNGSPVSAVLDTPQRAELLMLPNTPQVYRADVSLTVVDPTTQGDYPVFPDWVLQRYHETIKHGLLANMMAQPSKPYYSPQNAVYHMREFRAQTATAKTEVMKGHRNAAQRWRFPQTFAGSRR